MAISITVKIEVTKKQVEIIRRIGTNELPINGFVKTKTLAPAVNTLIKRGLVKVNDYHHRADQVELTPYGLQILKQL